MRYGFTYKRVHFSLTSSLKGSKGTRILVNEEYARTDTHGKVTTQQNYNDKKVKI